MSVTDKLGLRPSTEATPWSKKIRRTQLVILVTCVVASIVAVVCFGGLAMGNPWFDGTSIVGLFHIAAAALFFVVGRQYVDWIEKTDQAYTEKYS